MRNETDSFISSVFTVHVYVQLLTLFEGTLIARLIRNNINNKQSYMHLNQHTLTWNETGRLSVASDTHVKYSSYFV